MGGGDWGGVGVGGKGVPPPPTLGGALPVERVRLNRTEQLNGTAGTAETNVFSFVPDIKRRSIIIKIFLLFIYGNNYLIYKSNTARNMQIRLIIIIIII